MREGCDLEPRSLQFSARATKLQNKRVFFAHSEKKTLKRTWENSPLCGGLGVLHRGGLVALCEFFRELTLAFFPEVWDGTPFCALIFFYELSTVSGWHNLGMWQCFIDCSSARGIENNGIVNKLLLP